MSECSAQDSELIATENVKGSDILDNESPSADPYAHYLSDLCLRIRLFCVETHLDLLIYVLIRSKVTTNIINDMGPPSNIIDSPVVMKVTDKQSSTKQVAEPVLNEDSPAASSCWKEEDIDAPTSEFGTYPLLVYILDLSL